MKKIKKLTLLGIENDSFDGRFRTEFRFKKEQYFFECLKKLLSNLDWDKSKVEDIGVDLTPEGDRKEKISEYEGVVENYMGKDYDIDVFYVKTKVALIVRGSLKKRKRFIDEISKMFKWAKPKSLKKIKAKKKKKKK